MSTTAKELVRQALKEAEVEGQDQGKKSHAWLQGQVERLISGQAIEVQDLHELCVLAVSTVNANFLEVAQAVQQANKLGRSGTLIASYVELDGTVFFFTNSPEGVIDALTGP